MPARNFKELQARMSPERQKRNAAAAEQMLRDMPLDELRAAREFTQEHLASLLGIKQASISKMERRTDMYIGTLAKFIQAMGGQLEIRAIFPDGPVRITQFSEVEITTPQKQTGVQIHSAPASWRDDPERSGVARHEREPGRQKH
jgi:transcriptional regulator with XRE-family HTH domain